MWNRKKDTIFLHRHVHKHSAYRIKVCFVVST